MADYSPKAVRWIAGLLVFVAAGYLVAVPAAMLVWDAFFSESRPTIQKLDDMTSADWIRIKSIEAIMAGIFFALGASIGSFLNVVAYRLPQRIPLVFRRSRCPVCETPIEGRDNVPLWGWLKLGGRCRHCATPIPLRYPLAEAAIGTIFLWLFAVQLISGGWNLPNRTPNVYTGVVWILLYTKWDLVAYYFYHTLLFSLLFVLLLIDCDRLKLSLRQVLVCSVWLCLPTLIWPALYFWPLHLTPWPVGDSLLQWLCGAGLGVVIGSALDRKSHLTVGLAWVGVALGWQAVLGVAAVTSVLRLIGTLAAWIWNRSRNTASSYWLTPASWTAWLLAGTLVHHSMWRLAVSCGSAYWPGDSVNTTLFILWTTLMTVLVVINKAVGYLPTYTNTRPSAQTEIPTPAQSPHSEGG
ncbi:MAG: prepilin peptidase [Planctomycetaceae bacterium]|nr:prepilin peptidase [Planctomycetaceae bacterium]